MNLKAIDTQIAVLERKLKTLHKLRKDCQDPEYCDALSDVISTPMPRTRSRRRPNGAALQELLDVLSQAKRPMLLSQIVSKLRCSESAVRNTLGRCEAQLEKTRKGRFVRYALKSASPATTKS